MSSYDLLARLEAFLDSLPGSYDYAVQLSNPELLIPALFDTLSARNVALVMTDSNGMPSLLDQILSPFLFTADSLLVVSEMQDATLWRLGIVETVRRCVTEKKQLYCYFRDQEEARLHHGLLELMQMMNGDLAKLSPIKQRAA
ncbi:MAG: DUF72 domain-containing protein [Ignavibacteriae bacterium]|nr:DUF72 domain-containing protein [Ignavibacteriota bacterium]